ncbi:ADP-ribosylation factor-like protein 13A isoform X3 [Hemicordylus capensis]|uniref:ADP-ribosylation factor-like protein 13A isoform X3 n=1 Tax=Hemicordylus capensis TaxID=884348 RepID=UPI0023041654|nr:ADP-ribosylation factor-like protein 13A isoform X3 [Hemicordylus capensis]
MPGPRPCWRCCDGERCTWNVTILVLGLDGAGKSSLIKEIQRVLSCEVLPTRKPHQTELRVDRFAVSLVDLAGGPRSWGTWKNHYGTAHGIIFVLDSSDVARMEEAKKTLSRVLGHPRVSGKPLLLLANKQDHVDAILPCEVIECLSLEKLVNRNKSPCRMEPCSATKRLPKIQCWTIVQGLHWLLQTVAINYDVLCGRIQEDSPGRQRSPEREVSKKMKKAWNRMREDRMMRHWLAVQVGIRQKRELKPWSKLKAETLDLGHHHQTFISHRNTGSFQFYSIHRQSLTRRGSSQERNPKVDGSKVLKSPQNIPAQKEEKAPKKPKRKGKPKVKRKGLGPSKGPLAEEGGGGGGGKTVAGGSKAGAQGGRCLSNKVAQETPSALDTSPPPAGQSTKKKNKMLKNKIKSQEASQTQPDENPSGTFDLYRRAMLVLKMQQERRKPPSAAAP